MIALTYFLYLTCDEASQQVSRFFGQFYECPYFIDAHKRGGGYGHFWNLSIMLVQSSNVLLLYESQK